MQPKSLLPEGWSTPSLLADTIVAAGVELHRAGYSCTSPSGEDILGAAVATDAPPVDRSYLELLERVSVVDALQSRRESYPVHGRDGEQLGERAREDVFPENPLPARWRHARSNGVAVHRTWSEAATSAMWELAERDRLLRAWYGETRPHPIALTGADEALARTARYEWVACRFPGGSASFCHEVEVVGVFGFPDCDAAPVAAGYAARPTETEALAAASREALQVIGFLWGEPVARHLPEPSPTPLWHMDYYQIPSHRELLRHWLDHGHERYAAEPLRREEQAPNVTFVDLTPPWLGGGLRVARALSPSAIPLVFGADPRAEAFSPVLRTHPIA